MVHTGVRALSHGGDAASQRKACDHYPASAGAPVDVRA